MKVSTESFVASDGAELHLYVWLPESVEPRAVVQIVHGMGETGYRYARVAEALCESGYAVYLSDIRGHGHTAPDEASLGDLGPDGWNRCVQDQRELNDALRRRHPQRKAVLLGHSMGSFLAQQYLIDHGTTIDAAILSGSTKLGGGLLPHLAWGIARLEQWRIGDQEGSPLLEWLLFGRSAKSIPDAATPFDWLSRDPEEVQKYIDDPLCGNVLRPRSIVNPPQLPPSPCGVGQRSEYIEHRARSELFARPERMFHGPMQHGREEKADSGLIQTTTHLLGTDLDIHAQCL